MAADASEATQASTEEERPTTRGARVGWEPAKEWFLADRYRVFLGMAAVALLLGIVLLLLPDNLLTIGAAFLLVGLAAILGLLGLATWWAEQRGMTDGHDLWDAEDDDSGHAEEVLQGFSAFHFDDDDAEPEPGRA